MNHKHYYKFSLPLYKLTSFSRALALLLTLFLSAKFISRLLESTDSLIVTVCVAFPLLLFANVLLHEWAHATAFRLAGGVPGKTVFWIGLWPFAETEVPGLLDLPLRSKRTVIAAGWFVDFIVLGLGTFGLLYGDRGIATPCFASGLINVLRNGMGPTSDGRLLLLTYFYTKLPEDIYQDNLPDQY